MNLFESIIDETLKYYSKFVFDNHKSDHPKIKTRIRHKILEDCKKIADKIDIKEVFVKGSILTKNFTKDSDIDVFVRVSDELYTEDQLRILLKPIWEQIDDTLLEGVPHPFQYYITKEKYNMDNTEAAYDIINDDWIKRSPSKHIDIDNYIDDFKDYVQRFSDFSEELRRNMIDYEILKDLPQDEVKGLEDKLDKELKEINDSINELSDVYSDIKEFRNDAFANEMTPSEIKKYGIKTRLPGNVVFKLIERYHYLDLYKKIRKIIGSNNKLDHHEFDKLNQILKTKLTNEKTSFKTVFESPHTAPSYIRNNMIDQDYYNQEQYDETIEDWNLKNEFNFSGFNYGLYTKQNSGALEVRIVNHYIKMISITADFIKEGDKIIQRNVWRHNHFKEEMLYVYTSKILPLIKGKTLFSDTVQTPQGFSFWDRLLNKKYKSANCGVYNNKTGEYKRYNKNFNLNDYYDKNFSHYQFYIEVNDSVLTESTQINSLFGNIKGRKDLQHKPRHRQQQANAGLLGHGTRKHLNLMPKYQRPKGNKTDHGIDTAKKNGKIIRVKQGSPEAFRLAKKYRIGNPVGKKTVAGNQYDSGITIIFESPKSSLEKKVKNIKKKLIENKNSNILLGTSKNKELVNDIFGDVSNFTKLVETYGDNFHINNIKSKYDKKQDIHYLYITKNIIKESPHIGQSFGRYYPLNNYEFNQLEAQRVKQNGELITTVEYYDIPIPIYKIEDGSENEFYFLTKDTDLIMGKVILVKKDENAYTQELIFKTKLEGGLGKQLFYSIYVKSILELLKGKTILSDKVQTIDGFRFWENILIDNPNKSGVLNTNTGEKIPFENIHDINDYFDDNLSYYQFYINI